MSETPPATEDAGGAEVGEPASAARLGGASGIRNGLMRILCSSAEESRLVVS